MCSSSPTSDPDVFDGRLAAHEKCENGPSYDATQSAHAYREGDKLVIESTLEQVLPLHSDYWPDNFALTVVNGALMIGELRSASVASATFRRHENLVS